MPALPAIAAVMAVVGTSVSAYSAVASGESQKEAADYNAKVGQMKAQDALQRGAIDAAAKRDQAREVASTQAEGMAMSGVALDTGTPLALLTETAGLGELDALKVKNNAVLEGWGYKAQSDLDQFQGRNARTAGYLNGAGTFLGGTSNAYFGAKQAGLFS